MTTIVDGDFEWDDVKAASNLVKHGVKFEEAAGALASDPNEVSFADLLDSSRIQSLVLSLRDRVLLVISTEAGARTRIISARKANTDEQRIYLEGSSP